MRRYTQLTREERYQIYALNAAGHHQAEIARIIGRHKSTVSREICRNKGLRGYRPKQAHAFATIRRQSKYTARIKSGAWDRVEQLLHEDWSPEQISNWLWREENIRISHEWIYRYIFKDKQHGGELHTHLRCRKKRKKRYGLYDCRGHIKGRISIDERPDIVDKRHRVGDWEVDTVIGKQGSAVLVTVVERRTRYSVVAKAADKSASCVRDAILKHMGPISFQVKTLTYDNGKEFALHQQIAEKLNAYGYFAHPYHSWERALNENTNGLIRQYFPKGKDISNVSDEEIKTAMDKINNRPRKCLDFKTPNQVFWGLKPNVALTS